MSTEVQENVKEGLKKKEVEPVGELNGKAGSADLCSGGGKIDKSGCESVAPAEKEEPMTKHAIFKEAPLKQKALVQSGEEEDRDVPNEENDYSSEEDGEGDEEADGEDRVGDGEPYVEEDDDEEYVDDGEEDDGEDDESEPPSKRRK